MLRNQSLLTSERGFTLMELLVTASLTGLLTVLAIGSLNVNRNLFLDNVMKTRVEQNLRSGLNIISINIRQAGESLPGSFPAVELIDGVGSASDELILRRNLITEVLTLCNSTAAGSSTLYVSGSGTSNPACIRSNMSNAFSAWQDERDAQGGVARLYLWDRVSQVGEFVDYSNDGQESYGSRRYFLNTTTLSRAYPANNTSLYLVEEYLFRHDADESAIVLEIDGRPDEPQNVVFNVDSFDVDIRLQDGTIINEMLSDGPNQWKNIRSVNVTLTGLETYRGKDTSKSVNGSYFPRNVLSVED